ncbi:MAG TPA: malto-oligosyltrehalose trehalohydrolase, partial [Jatrophihabitantaceae bacterium]|nr:malto-oligosyltrehalose trehalohydrolase [Jatrophihabitantaceae bacterium]
SEIRVWAPNATTVRMVVHGAAEPMTSDGSGGPPADKGVAGGGGWWRGGDLEPGTDYAFLLSGGPPGNGGVAAGGETSEPRPDPASRWQPEGVHGPSRVYDQSAYPWQDASWRGRELDGGIVYELHIGTFTPGATFDSAIERLDHLVGLGVTHVELLPVNAFNGVWNWGYDGVDWYAVHEPYGGPDGLKRFVDACHARGLAVVLDVVYNHLGPSGNYLPEFGPYLKSGRNTWGDLVNLEEPAVRRFVIDNALMWLRDFHVDALRLDAVHALIDTSPVHVLAQLSAEVADLSAELGRPLTLIAESDLNDPVMITSQEHGGYGLDAQWDDDVHHALHSALTGERQGYYCDFGPLSVLAKTLTRAFFHDGTYSTFRGKVWGRPVDRATTPGWRFVVCLQNHDQVGNRAVGDRLPELTTTGLLRVGATLLLTSPFTPMLWMGEEWAASTRWPFFTSHPEPELGRVTGEGRLAEFGEHGWDVSQMIDPQDPAAYREAVLDWDELADAPHRQMLEFYRRLIALRAAEPDLRAGDLAAVQVDCDDEERWIVVHRGALRVAANLSDQPREFDLSASEVVFGTDDAVRLDGGTLQLPAESAAIVRIG